jgi:hypothetical protein
MPVITDASVVLALLFGDEGAGADVDDAAGARQRAHRLEKDL